MHGLISIPLGKNLINQEDEFLCLKWNPLWSYL